MRDGIRVLLIAVVASLAATLLAARLAPNVAPPEESPKPASEKSAIDWGRGHSDRVLFLGHSFARDWFRHWGWDGRRPVKDRGLSLYFGDLDKEPGGAKAAASYLEGAPADVAVFFMLGPRTLSGGTAKRAEASVDRALAEVDAIAAVVSEGGRRFFVGGPLPSLDADTDAHLVEAQHAYLQGLRKREDAGMLVVFDPYEAMASGSALTLTRGYALTPAESRVGPAGFDALDGIFFPFVRERL